MEKMQSGNAGVIYTGIIAVLGKRTAGESKNLSEQNLYEAFQKKIPKDRFRGNNSKIP